ncbi:PAS domain S-box-containing protein [Saccharicrinis carchari]|uniref:histidine kinase n=1 Tax=Saccharicrinis carchari TaxID=1168039 RepID=A0A521F5E6_SACCC|nr:PAS domain-containing sensor histidine kinase [Saccharicrinis carchari]SMO91353.1 PAS domain S-box-containing protein [Saccharicrinis carchari]
MVEIVEGNEDLIKELQELKQENKVLIALYEKNQIELNLMKTNLRQSEIRFQHLLQDIENISVQGYGFDGTTHFWNRASEKLYGYSTQEAIGRNLLDLIIPPEMKEFVKESIKEMVVTGKPIPAAELSRIRKDGSLVSVFSSHEIINIPGQMQEFFCIDIDLTKLKQTEKELFSTEESDCLKSAFLANIGHEIRTPMNGILGFAELLKHHELTADQQQKYIRIIEQSGIRMLNIINNIIDISKVETGLVELDIIEYNINEQCEHIYTCFRPEADAKGIKFSLKTSLPIEEVIITTDRKKLNTILINLVKNAIKYTNAGTIELGCSIAGSKTQKELQFYVKDTGIGIPKDRFEAIFKRFVQADIHNKMAHQGAGLGLSITEAYLEMLGGKIWVESEEGIGSTFYFTLPCNAKQIQKTIQKDCKSSASYMDIPEQADPLSKRWLKS